MAGITAFEGILWLYDHLNALATLAALILSTASIGVQYRRYKREVGKLELISINEEPYSVGEGEWQDEYGDMVVSNNQFIVNVTGRNNRDGTLSIYDIEFRPDELDESIPLTSHTDMPLKIPERDSLNKRLIGELTYEIELEGNISGTLHFETSNGDITYQITFPPE